MYLIEGILCARTHARTHTHTRTHTHERRKHQAHIHSTYAHTCMYTPTPAPIHTTSTLSGFDFWFFYTVHTACRTLLKRRNNSWWKDATSDDDGSTVFPCVSDQNKLQVWCNKPIQHIIVHLIITKYSKTMNILMLPLRNSFATCCCGDEWQWCKTPTSIRLLAKITTYSTDSLFQ